MLIAGLGYFPLSLAGLGTLDVFARTIQQVEGFFPPGTPGFPAGSIAWQNNNPGNLRYVPYYAASFGATPGVGGYARFPNYQTGWAALEHQIQVDADSGLTIRQMMAKYAPAQDGNDPESYAQTIAVALGVSVDTPVLATIGDSPAQVASPDNAQPAADPGTVVLAGMELPTPIVFLGAALLVAAFALITERP